MPPGQILLETPQMENDEPLIYRVGLFFYVIGGGAFVLFVVSDFAKKPDYDFFFTALAMFVVGGILRRGRPAPPSAERFSWLRKTIDERKNKKGKDAKKK
jgi:hypothetical protein